MLHFAHVTVYVNGQELRRELMTEEEMESVREALEELFQTYGTRQRFEIAATDDILVFCVEENCIVPFPKEWETKVLAFANGKEYRLIGERFPVACRPLGDRVEFKLTNFEEE